MILLNLFVCNIVWIIFCLSEGVREGFYTHYENTSRKVCNFDLSPIFNIQRIIFLFAISSYLLHVIGLLSIFSIISKSLMFSYFHNGTYYYSRNKLNERIYIKGWFDSDKVQRLYTTKLPYITRTILMSIGFILETFVYLFFLN